MREREEKRGGEEKVPKEGVSTKEINRIAWENRK
tara:strand:+ start:1188 stop:1289 length:102 start_codon:yes stop_codon:yes gene_type:complete